MTNGCGNKREKKTPVSHLESSQHGRKRILCKNCGKSIPYRYKVPLCGKCIREFIQKENDRVFVLVQIGPEYQYDLRLQTRWQNYRPMFRQVFFSWLPEPEDEFERAGWIEPELSPKPLDAYLHD